MVVNTSLLPLNTSFQIKEMHLNMKNKKSFKPYPHCLERHRAGAQGVAVDHVLDPGEAEHGLRPLYPGRLRAVQGDDQHRLQLCAARAD